MLGLPRTDLASFPGAHEKRGKEHLGYTVCACAIPLRNLETNRILHRMTPFVAIQSRMALFSQAVSIFCRPCYREGGVEVEDTTAAGTFAMCHGIDALLWLPTEGPHYETLPSTSSNQ